MREKVRWGIISSAKIGTAKVIPAMQRGEWSEVVAIASRDAENARRAASKLGIRKACGSYEELLADPDVEAIYNPLPNHMHVPWSIRAAEAGKHVLCEKPIALTVAECRTLIDARNRTGVKIGEAFMVRTHPQLGVNMEQFPTSAHVASWAALCPGNNESAGKRMSGKTRKGNV